MRGGWVYILTSRPNGIFYTGITGAIATMTKLHEARR